MKSFSKGRIRQRHDLQLLIHNVKTRNTPEMPKSRICGKFKFVEFRGGEVSETPFFIHCVDGSGFGGMLGYPPSMARANTPRENRTQQLNVFVLSPSMTQAFGPVGRISHPMLHITHRRNS